MAADDQQATDPPEDASAAETDAAESDAAESDAAESDAAESDAAESDTAESDAAESDAAETDAAKAKAKAKAKADEPGALKRFRVWLSETRIWFRGRYLQVDPRTLGVYRIIIGVLLCADCIRHWTFARRFYSNAGVLSNDWHLYVPSSDYNFSLFHSFSSPAEVHVAFALSMFCYAMFAVGFKTRLFTVLSLLWVTSMDNRLVMVENGGYVVVNLSVFWAMFLPTGRRFSVDALIASWRQRREGSTSELNDRQPRDTRAYVSIASFIIVLNFAIIYIFNVVNKYGATWRTGKTTHFVLHIDRMVTLPAVWLRELLPFPVHMFSTWAVLTVEATIVMAILWPKDRLITRPFALVLIFLLHTSFGVLMRLGPFSWFMIGYSSILLMACHWEWLAARHVRKTPAVELSLSTVSGLAWWLCRWLKRLDPTERITFVDGSAHTLALGDRRDAAALFGVLRVLPTGQVSVPVLRVLSLGLFDVVVRGAFAFEQRLSRFFGWGAPPASHRAAEQSPSVVRHKLNKGLFALHEIAIVYFALCAASQVINENKSIPKVLKHEAPKFVKATVGYPRLFQGWGMFAPNPIREDGIMTVDAITIDGRHIDPFTGEEPDLNLSDARGTGFDQIEQDYFNRIRLDRNKTFRGQMEKWIQRYHLETGRPEDEIVFFNAYWLRDQNPDPGGITPSKHEMLCIHSYQKRRYRPKPPLSPLPKKCKVVSADKDALHKKEKAKKGESVGDDEEKANRPWWERALTF